MTYSWLFGKISQIPGNSWYSWQNGNPPLAFSKLVLDDVKVDILLISWLFWWFLVASPICPFNDTFMFWYIKGVQVVHIWVKFKWPKHLFGHLSHNKCVLFLSVLTLWSDLYFSSFEISNVFMPAESIILGCFWPVFWT